MPEVEVMLVTRILESVFASGKDPGNRPTHCQPRLECIRSIISVSLVAQGRFFESANWPYNPAEMNDAHHRIRLLEVRLLVTQRFIVPRRRGEALWSDAYQDGTSYSIQRTPPW